MYNDFYEGKFITFCLPILGFISILILSFCHCEFFDDNLCHGRNVDESCEWKYDIFQFIPGPLLFSTFSTLLSERLFCKILKLRLLYFQIHFIYLEHNCISLAAVNREMGMLSTLLKWNEIDPPSREEKLRNERICIKYQHNRNPFVDHPEYAKLIWKQVV